MATQVLLMNDVKDLGSEGDVVTVADGFARNYLVPQNLAAPVTEATRRRLAKMQKAREAQRKAALVEAHKQAERFKDVSVTIPVKTGEESKLYGSVTSSDIVASLSEQGLKLDRHDLLLPEPIRELGVFDVTVRLHADVTATIKVWVVEE